MRGFGNQLLSVFEWYWQIVGAFCQKVPLCKKIVVQKVKFFFLFIEAAVFSQKSDDSDRFLVYFICFILLFFFTQNATKLQGWHHP